ncbi:MAG: hypothetical protein NZ561_01860, partial [Phycisphaerae bacterium]|nr:hypothetical protein [Phycisphaerae bacterium]MDW8263316.1 hypothetical protein [Phycisphaerales bacterium]
MSAALPTRAQLSTLAVLLPSKPAHLAVDRGGTVYVSQPTDTGRDLVLRIGQSQTLETTALTSAAIAQSLGNPELKGNLHALCAGADGHLYFYFASTTGRRSEFALGQYHTRTAIVRILADSKALLRASGLGASLELAAPQLAATDSAIYLSLATIDSEVVLKFDLHALNRPGMVELSRAFVGIRLGEERISLSHPGVRLCSNIGRNLLVVDGHT